MIRETVRESGLFFLCYIVQSHRSAYDMICGIIAPRQSDIVGYRGDGYLAECILPYAHFGRPHVIRTPEGKFWAWEDDAECGCCEPDEVDRCYSFEEITPDKASECGASL